MQKKTNDLRAWTTQDAAELYQVKSWGNGYFDINKQGHLTVLPGPKPVSLCALVEDLQQRGHQLPVLVRFPQILQDRVAKLFGAFDLAIKEHGYKGSYRAVYPIKVNQQRDVVEELLEFGEPFGLGLEAGSKPELLVALAYMDAEDGVIVCNGYKDAVYIETALLAQQLGRHPILVVDRFEELDAIIHISQKLGLRPHIGLRAKLASKGAGKWVESAGEKSKFGLNATEMLQVMERLRSVGMLDCLELLHFHIGSQITAIRAIKDALRESCRIYVELCKLGANLKFVDVGGGLAVDYDGSKTSFHSSTNYSMQEYANDVVFAIHTACEDEGIPHPQIISESGRALVAYHSVLIFDVLGSAEVNVDSPPNSAAEHENSTVQAMYEAWKNVSHKNFQESYHDALHLKEEGISMFNLGLLDLKGRALVEKLFWAICHRVNRMVKGLDYVPEEFEGLDKALADTFYCNFSIFQSVPDHWAVKQLFPVMPLQRLHEEPRRRAILADLTCDSDGKVDRFIDLRDEKHALEVHDLRPGQPYYMGMFLVGAYQEILGDLHNLFGDTTAIHVSADETYGYNIDRVIEGDSVNEVLNYVNYDRQSLIRRVRRAAEAALRRGDLKMDHSARLLKRFEDGLAGYTYLSRAELVEEQVDAAKKAAVETSAEQTAEQSQVSAENG